MSYKAVTPMVGRGTENGAAKFAAVFRLSMKNHRGAFAPPHRVAGYNWGCNCVLIVIVTVIEDVLGILTLKHG